jgi:hypothetical protein
LRRVLAAIVIFAGWACIPVGAMAGLVTSRFLGLNLVEGELPPQSVYGFSAAVVMLVLVSAALLTSIPLARAMFAVSPRRTVDATAIAMAVVGIVLIPDELGRAFGLPLLIGAAAMAFGGRLLLLEAAATGVVTATNADLAGSGPAATWIYDTMDLAGGGTPGPMDASTASAAPGSGPTSPALPEATPGRGKSPRKRAAKTTLEVTCQWCSSVVPADATTCPTCQAPLNAPDIGAMPISGVTEVSPELRAYAAQARTGKKRTGLLKMMFSDTPVPQAVDAPPPSDAAALRPPSPELRAEMARLDAEIASGRPASGSDQAWVESARPTEATLEDSPEATDEATPDQRT